MKSLAANRKRSFFQVRAAATRGAYELHAEHAETRAILDRCVETGGYGEAQHAASVGGIDDAVVPQARRGVVRVALRFVLLPDRRLEGVFVLGRPCLASSFEAVAFH